MSGTQQTNGETPGRERSRRSDLAVMSQEEYRDKRRLEAILDAHDRVEEADEYTLEMLATGELSHEARNIILVRSVQSFIRESYNLIRTYVDEEGEPDGYWVREEPLGAIHFEHNDNVEFYGLCDLLSAKRYYVEEWTEQVNKRHRPPREETKEEFYTVPEEISLRGHLLLKKFLAEERDLELAFEERSAPLEV